MAPGASPGFCCCDQGPAVSSLAPPAEVVHLPRESVESYRVAFAQPILHRSRCYFTRGIGPDGRAQQRGFVMRKFLSIAISAILTAPAFAADLPARVPVKAPVAVVDVCIWCGLYIGGNVGGAWTRSDVTTTNVGRSPSACSTQGRSLATFVPHELAQRVLHAVDIDHTTCPGIVAPERDKHTWPVHGQSTSKIDVMPNSKYDHH